MDERWTAVCQRSSINARLVKAEERHEERNEGIPCRRRFQPNPADRRLASGKTNWALIIIRILTAFAGLMIFFPEVNPGRLMSDINANTSLFTAAISYNTLTDSFARPLRMGWVQPWHFYLIMGGCALLMLGIILSAIGACMSLGNHRMKRAAVKLPLIGSVLMLGGIGMLVYLNSILPALERQTA